MKSVKKLFKRKKKQNPQTSLGTSTDSRQTSASSACLDTGTKASSVQTSHHRSQNQDPAVEKPAQKQAPSGVPSGPQTGKKSVPQVPSKKKEGKPQSVHSNGGSAKASTTRDTAAKSKIETKTESKMDANESSSQSLKKHKGVSESFKGMTIAHRFDVKDPGQVTNAGEAYDTIPLLEQTKLPRGGISIETKSVGRVQVCDGMIDS